MHLGLIKWPFVPHNLISAKWSPVSLPKFQMAPRLKILNVLWVQERNPDILSFSLKKSQQTNLLLVPQWGPFGERDLSAGHFYVSLDLSLFIFPLESLVREPLPYSLTGSPWTGILRHQSHWSIYLFIHSFMYVCQSPQKGALLQ